MLSLEMISFLHPYYREDLWINEIYKVIGNQLDRASGQVAQMERNIIVSTASIHAIERYEAELKIKPNKNQSLSDRAAVIIARWRSNGKSTLAMLQNIADSWKNGATEITFINGVITITFISVYGIPEDIKALYAAIEEMKPAHLPIKYIFKYHTWGDWANMIWGDLANKTWGEMYEG